MASNPTKEVLHDLSPLIKIYKDGFIERPMATPHVPPSPENPTTGIASKDITISPEVKARLFLPKLTNPNQKQKLPILVYFHGGAFVYDTPYSSLFHNFTNVLAAETKALIVSVEYRLAPEHPLPIAYEDSWAALQWVGDHRTPDTNIEKDLWLTEYGDFDKLYIGGDSAGANIAHNTVLRAGVENLPGNVKILGLFLSHPYFWGSKPIGVESKEDFDGKHLACRVWLCAYPSAAGGIDSPMINPFSDDAPSLSGLACSKLLVCLAEKDLMTQRGILYAVTVEKSGWSGEVKLVVVDGEEHCFHVLDPHTEKAKDLFKQLASFIS